MPRLVLPLCALLLAGGHARAGFDTYLTGGAADAEVTTTGGLLLAGGGGDVDEAFRWFARRAGGGDIVVLRASGSDGYNDYLHREIGGVDSVETIVFHDRESASAPPVLDTIARAEGIFIAGGDQSRYVRFWSGTPLAARLEEHVRRGKPLGGTSAGLAVLGQFAFSAREPGDLTSAIALRDPFDQRITLEHDFLRLDLMRGVITDTHFMARKRLGRTLVFLARLQALAPPRLLALGVDEGTALCLEADGSGRVLSRTKDGAVWLIVPTQPAELTPGAGLTLRNVRVVAVGPESDFNLRSLEVSLPRASSLVSSVDGRLSQTP
jgi:beta-aspartyl-peptidase (threonine type)